MQEFPYDLRHRHQRVECGIAVLKDDLRLAAMGFQSGGIEVGDMGAANDDLCRSERDRPLHHYSCCRLAGPRYATRQRMELGGRLRFTLRAV